MLFRPNFYTKMSSDDENSNDPLQLAINIAISLRDRIVQELEAGEPVERVARTRRVIDRERDLAEERLFRDYFYENSTYPAYNFRRRFRMHKPLFLKIVQDMEAASDYFKKRPNARGTLGFHPIQKCTAVMRMLAYGTQADALDESIRMSARVARESLINFCDLAITMYGDRYMRAPRREY